MSAEIPPDETKDLEERLARAQKAIRPETPGAQDQASGMGVGYRLSIDLVSGILVGAFMGYWLDRWLGTSPAFLIGLFLLGCVAGYVNMMRTLRQMDVAKADNPDDTGG